MKKALTALLGVLVYIVFVLDRMILSLTFKQLPSFETWLENEFDYTSYHNIKSSTLRVATFMILAVFHYLAAWWGIVLFWAISLIGLGLIGYNDIKNNRK
jgi:archaellum biogenesis protein FlaJ (TadC family)